MQLLAAANWKQFLPVDLAWCDGTQASTGDDERSRISIKTITYLVSDPGFARSFLAIGPMLINPGELVLGMDNYM